MAYCNHPNGGPGAPIFVPNIFERATILMHSVHGRCSCLLKHSQQRHRHHLRRCAAAPFAAAMSSSAVMVDPIVEPSSSHHHVNGVRSPVAQGFESSVPPPASETVSIAPADAATRAASADETEAAVASAVEAIKAQVVAMNEPTELADEPVPAPVREPIEYTVRSPEDDARALAQAKRRLEIQISFVEKARKQIQDESHVDFIARMQSVDAEREQLLALAKGKEEYWAHCTSVIFAYECEEATSEYTMNCERLRQDMLDEIHQEMEILHDQRKGSSAARKTTRKTRSTRTKGSSDEKGLAAGLEGPSSSAQKVKKRVGSVFQQLENRLAPSEVDHDLRELLSTLEVASKKRRVDTEQAPVVAKYHRSNFLYRDAIYQEGDEIYVRNLMNGSEFVAVICSVTTTELFVLSEKGKYSRLVLMDLRQGRVTVSPLTSEQRAAVDEREAMLA